MTQVNKSKYLELWKRYLPAIIKAMKNCNTNHFVLLNPYEFKIISYLKSYSFYLTYIDGKVSNNINGSALARDLAAAIEDSAEAMQLLEKGNIKFKMDNKFCFWISRQENNVQLVLDFNHQHPKGE